MFLLLKLKELLVILLVIVIVLSMVLRYFLLFKTIKNMLFLKYILIQIPNSEGRAGMASIVDKDNTLDITSISEGLQKALPVYARPLFIRKLNEVELTGKI